MTPVGREQETGTNIHTITSETGLEAAIGEPVEFVRAIIATELDELMTEFIRRSPLVFVSTVDANGHVDISPKGDPGGFIQVDDGGNLLIPERPGNRPTFGFRNILHNGETGLLFVVPNPRETLRVKGLATPHKDPEVLDRMQVNGKPALLYTRVDVKECFIHCGKALIRSRLWKPENRDTTTESPWAHDHWRPSVAAAKKGSNRPRRDWKSPTPETSTESEAGSCPIDPDPATGLTAGHSRQAQTGLHSGGYLSCSTSCMS